MGKARAHPAVNCRLHLLRYAQCGVIHPRLGWGSTLAQRAADNNGVSLESEASPQPSKSSAKSSGRCFKGSVLRSFGEAEIKDEGKGMSLARLAEVQSGRSGVGIRGIKERLRQFDGMINIESRLLWNTRSRHNPPPESRITGGSGQG